VIKNFFAIYKSLSISFKKKSILFVFFLIISTILEILGIGLVIPVLDLLTNSQSPSIEKLTFLSNYLDITSLANLLGYILLTLIFVYVLKSIVLMLFYFWRNKFIWNAYKSISSEILRKYVVKDLDFYFKNNSTELINNTYLESRNYVSCLNEYLKMISEAAILLAILGFLFIYDFYSTLIVSILILISSILITYFTKKKVKKLGEVRIQASIGQLKNLQQIFFSIKDIKLKSLEFNFLEKYNKVIGNYSKSAYLSGTILELPKILFEIIFVLSISLVIYMLDTSNFSEGNVITKIGIYAVAAFRSFPSVTRIIYSTQQISFLKPSIKKILPNLLGGNETRIANKKSIKKIDFINDLKIENITYKYPGKKLPAVKNFSLTVNKGDFIGIIGKSGEGKSTILDLIMGLIKPSSGKILIDGKDIQTNINGWQQNLGYVSQSTNLLDESIKNNIAFGVSEDQIDNKKLLDASKNSQIYEFISSLKEKFESQVGERGIALSGGQIQRIGIARELYRDPPIILLDEATSALDLDTEKEFLKCLDQLKGNKTIVFVSHRKSALENCNKIIDLNLDA
tara:strand:- start:4226 stop:5935 length:1710 start_codon:yes stop_codon:yes gene_type:complete